MKLICKALLLGAVAAVSMTAHAAKKDEEPRFAADTKSAFVDQAAAVRKQMDEGGRYEFVNTDERAKVNARLDEIGAILDQGDVASLPKAKVAELYVAQEEVNAILTKRDGRRVICERVKTIGSNMKSQQCITYAEQERGRRVTQDAVRNTMRPAQKKAEAFK